MKDTDLIREELAIACTRLQNDIHQFKIMCKNSNWDQAIVNITESFTEIFPNVMAKVIFSKENGSKSIIIKAKAGSKVNPHKMMPNRFVYVVNGEQRDETGIIVLNEDEGMVVKPFQELAMYFPVDTKLIMDIDTDN